MSTALTYLDGARHRPNLTIRSEAVVDRVELGHGRATGVRLVDGEVIEASQVVLAAGAYASPAILARSGIGPADHLAELDIDIVSDVSGVGENLLDHPIVAVDVPAARGITGPRFQAMATLRSHLAASDPAPDLHLFVAGPFDVAKDVSSSGAVFGVVAGLMSPRSRGRVRLRSTDPTDPPRIDVAHLKSPDDLARMVEATVAARRLARTGPLAERVAGHELAPGPGVADDDPQSIAASIKARVSTYHHPVGTCRMGPDPGEGAVVDARGRVHGVDRLHVSDASVMPTIPSANTNLPTIMVAERIAAWLREN
jgi:choline dehydrogenase